MHPRSADSFPPYSSMLPASVQRQVRDVEQRILGDDAVGGAFWAWAQHACAPYASLELMMWQTGHRWASPPYPRDVLEDAIRALPPRAGGILVAVVRPIDERAFARTLPDPFGEPADPWWHRRLWTR